MTTKKNATLYKKNKKTSKYGGKKSRRTTRKNRRTRTKKGGALNPADKIGTKMQARDLLTDPKQYIGRILRCPDAQEAGKISSILRLNDEQIKVFFEEYTGYNNTTDTIIRSEWIIYIE